MHRDSGLSFSMFIMGAAFGAIVAALYTPLSGPAMRRRLSKAVEDGAEMVRDGFDQAFEQADDFVAETTASAKDAVTEARRGFNKARREGNDAAE